MDDKKFKKEVGRLLRTARESVNMSQQEVATYMNVSQDAISNYELGKSNITPYKLLKFSRMYRKPVNFFFMVDVAEFKSTKPSQLGKIQHF